MDTAETENKIAILVVAYNHAGTLAKVLDRIPAFIWERVSEVVVIDDASQDDTFLVGKGYSTDRGQTKLTILKNKENLGYGGNQKKGYQYCIEKGYDIVVLLHGDGQYAPEVMWELIKPVDSGEAAAVFGSRVMVKGAALRGGMPLYKYIGNRILSRFENKMLGSDLTEFHSGYRVYSLHALKAVPFQFNTNDFHFDTEIIIQFLEGGFRIKEVPIPTYYGDEICYVAGMKYAKNVFKAVMNYWLWKRGILAGGHYNFNPRQYIYHEKNGPYSSHVIIARNCPPGKVLDIGCAEGFIGRKLIAKGCEVTGIDIGEKGPEGYKAYYSYDLNKGLPAEVDLKSFSTVILADVLEHLVYPEKLLHDILRKTAPDATVIASTGNVANWHIRFALLFGFFPYARKGILDQSHVRFFTIGSFRKLWEENGFRTTKKRYSVFPFEELFSPRVSIALSFIYYILTRLMPGLFAYQTILFLRRDPSVQL